MPSGETGDFFFFLHQRSIYNKSETHSSSIYHPFLDFLENKSEPFSLISHAILTNKCALLGSFGAHQR